MTEAEICPQAIIGVSIRMLMGSSRSGVGSFLYLKQSLVEKSWYGTGKVGGVG
jgi:hypothetical protein